MNEPTAAPLPERLIALLRSHRRYAIPPNDQMTPAEYWDAMDEAAAALAQRDGIPRDDARAKYEELLYAVGNKYPGETRHETALRYLREREQGQDADQGAKATCDPSTGKQTAERKA